MMVCCQTLLPTGARPVGAAGGWRRRCGMWSNFARHRREAGWGRMSGGAKAQRFRAISASAVLSALFRGSALQRHNASAIQRFSDSAIQRFRVLRAISASAVLSALFRGSALQRHNASALPRFSDSAIQRFSDSAIQRFSASASSAIQRPPRRQRLSGTQRALSRLSASAAQRFRASSIQRFRASAIQRFRDSAPPRHGQLYTSQAFL